MSLKRETRFISALIIKGIFSPFFSPDQKYLSRAPAAVREALEDQEGQLPPERLKEISSPRKDGGEEGGTGALFPAAAALRTDSGSGRPSFRKDPQAASWSRRSEHVDREGAQEAPAGPRRPSCRGFRIRSRQRSGGRPEPCLHGRQRPSEAREQRTLII